jgi:hypothetical protein
LRFYCKICATPAEDRAAPKPVIYSVGIDRDDDGGHWPDYAKSAGRAKVMPWDIQVSRTAVPDGDWVLYPEPVEEDGERE